MIDIRTKLWEAYFSLQAVGLIPPVVLLALSYMRGRHIEDKKSLRRYWLKQILYFLILFFAISFILGAMVELGYIDPPPGYQKP